MGKEGALIELLEYVSLSLKDDRLSNKNHYYLSNTFNTFIPVWRCLIKDFWPLPSMKWGGGVLIELLQCVTKP